MSKQTTIKERLSTARKLIKNGRYDAAHYILEQINHPKAQAMLKVIEGRQEKPKSASLISGQMAILSVFAITITLGLILAIRYIPPLIEASQYPDYEDYYDAYDDIPFVSDDEILYAHVASYCYHITGYGGELCLDWTDSIVVDYRAIVRACFAPYVDTGIMNAENYADVSNCLQENVVPPPL